MLLNNEWVNQGIKEELKKCMEKNENESIVVQNLRDTVTLLRGNCIAIQAYFKKQEKSLITLTPKENIKRTNKTQSQ